MGKYKGRIKRTINNLKMDQYWHVIWNFTVDEMIKNIFKFRQTNLAGTEKSLIRSAEEKGKSREKKQQTIKIRRQLAFKARIKQWIRKQMENIIMG